MSWLSASFIIFCLLMLLISPVLIYFFILNKLIQMAAKERHYKEMGICPKWTFFEKCLIVIGHICLIDFFSDIFK